MAMTINGGQTVRVTSAANVNADIVLPSVAGMVYQITSVLASYSASPTTARFGVLSNALVVIDLDLSLTQAGIIPLPYPLSLTEDVPGASITIRLFAGGIGIVGKLMVGYTASVVA